MPNSIQAGELAHYTWVIDEIMVEEASTKINASSYSKPFADTENSHGIPSQSIKGADINDLVSLIGNFFRVSYAPVKNIPISAKGQRAKIKNNYIKRVLQRSDKLYEALNVNTPDIDQPEIY